MTRRDTPDHASSDPADAPPLQEARDIAKSFMGAIIVAAVLIDRTRHARR